MALVAFLFIIQGNKCYAFKRILLFHVAFLAVEMKHFPIRGGTSRDSTLILEWYFVKIDR